MKIKADKSISMESEEENMLFGTLEAGGTKMVLSVGNEQNELLEQVSIRRTRKTGQGFLFQTVYGRRLL